MKSRLFKWKATFASCVQDPVEIVVAKNLPKAIETLQVSRGEDFVRSYLLKVEFLTVL